jgi:hypothetical protein
VSAALGIIVGGWAAFIGIVAPTPVAPLEAPQIAQEVAHEAQDAFVSAYTCQSVPANPMVPCGTTRWGNSPFTHGAACPESWAWRQVFAAGRWWTCDDTPRHDFINGLPHIDLRMATYAEAIRWGVQTIEIGVSE